MTFKKAIPTESADATQAGFSTTFTIRESYGKWARRLVAVADHSREQASPIVWRQNRWHATEQNGDAVFRDLPLAAIQEFRFQVRPFYWVEFKNVAFQPGPTKMTITTDPAKRSITSTP
jgi:hypothetical protein